jgi:hypothetical protein
MSSVLHKEKVKALAKNAQDLMTLYQGQTEMYKKLLRICLTHLEDRRRLVPDEVWTERKQLIEAIKEITK